MLIKCQEKKLDGNYTRMLWVILNKSWKQNPTKQQLYGHLPPITKTIQVRWTRHEGHCWRSKDKLIRDILQWTPTHGCTSTGGPERTYLQYLCTDTGCNSENLLGVVDNRDKWRERELGKSMLTVRLNDDDDDDFKQSPQSHSFSQNSGNVYLFNPSTMSRMWHKVNFTAGLNLEFSFSYTCYLTKAKELSWP